MSKSGSTRCETALKVSPEKAALFLMPEKFARKYDVSGVINKYIKEALNQSARAAGIADSNSRALAKPAASCLRIRFEEYEEEIK